MGVQYAKAMGYKVLAVDVKDKQLQFAKDCGADAVINAATCKNVKEEVDRITGNSRGVQAALVTSASHPAYRTGFEITRSHGRIVAIGLPRGHLHLTADDIIMDCKEQFLFVVR